MGHLLANHAAGADRGAGARRRRSEARIRRHDGHEEDRRRRDHGGATRLRSGTGPVLALADSGDRSVPWPVTNPVAPVDSSPVASADMVDRRRDGADWRAEAAGPAG